MALPRDLWGGFHKELPKRLLGLARGKEVAWAGSSRGPRPAPLMALTQSGPTCAGAASASTCFRCVVAVVFGSVIVTESEATQKCFCELSAPQSPGVQSRRKVGPSPPCSAKGHLQLRCCGPFRRARPGHGGAAVEPDPPGPLFCLRESC